MPRHVLAGALVVLAACAVIGILPAAVLAARELSIAGIILALVVMLGVAAVLVNAGVDLW